LKSLESRAGCHAEPIGEKQRRSPPRSAFPFAYCGCYSCGKTWISMIFPCVPHQREQKRLLDDGDTLCETNNAPSDVSWIQRIQFLLNCMVTKLSHVSFNGTSPPMGISRSSMSASALNSMSFILSSSPSSMSLSLE
jgi:hypothetical protein